MTRTRSGGILSQMKKQAPNTWCCTPQFYSLTDLFIEEPLDIHDIQRIEIANKLIEEYKNDN